MMEDRREEDRRVDPNAWSEKHHSQVKMIFAMVVAGFFMINGAVVITWAVMNETVNSMIAGLGVGMIAVGFLAAFPSRTMPIISLVLKRFGFGKLDMPSVDTAMLDAIDLVIEDKKDG
jgi:hypothetical protein